MSSFGVSVYERKGAVFIAPNSRPRGSGVRKIHGPCQVMNKADSPKDFGRAVISLLSYSRDGIDASEITETNAVIEASGAKSWREFYVGAIVMSIYKTDARFSFTTYKKEGAGWVPIDGPSYDLPITATDEEIGLSLLKTLSRNPN